jgi:hypothetical protein
MSENRGRNVLYQYKANIEDISIAKEMNSFNTCNPNYLLKVNIEFEIIIRMIF